MTDVAATLHVSAEVISSISTRLTVTVPNARIDADYEKRLARVAKTVKINGFRPGKVPMAKVRSDYGPSVRQDVINDLIRDTLYEAMQEKELRVVGVPSVDSVDMKEEGLHYTATVETYPTVDVTAFSGLNIVQKTGEVSDADVDAMIEQLRAQRKTFNAKEGAAALGDQVTFDFEGSVDGELFEGGAAKNHTLTLGSGRMIPGFEDGIVGMAAGEEKVIDVTFPEDYQAENLKGKAAQFKINLHKVEEAVLPALDDAFIGVFGVKPEEGVEKFKADVRKNMERELKTILTNLNKTAIFDALVEANTVDVPQGMLKDEIDRQRQQLLQQFSQQFGGKMPKFNNDMLPDDLFTDRATKSVKLGVLLSKVLEDAKLEVDQDKVTSFVNELAESYEDKDEVIKHFTTDQRERGQIEAVVLENQIADHIVAGATVTTETVSYEAAKQAQMAAQQDQ